MQAFYCTSVTMYLCTVKYGYTRPRATGAQLKPISGLFAVFTLSVHRILERRTESRNLLEWYCARLQVMCHNNNYERWSPQRSRASG